jgi:hypothetical protein
MATIQPSKSRLKIRGAQGAGGPVRSPQGPGCPVRSPQIRPYRLWPRLQRRFAHDGVPSHPQSACCRLKLWIRHDDGSVAPKANKTGSGGSITAKFVAPKAKKVEPEVIAKVDTPSKPLLLAPATASTAVAVDQGAPAPKPVAKAIPVETPDAGQIETTPREVALAYLRASHRYGYGAYTASYSDSEDYGSYEESAYDQDYSSANDSDENCW